MSERALPVLTAERRATIVEMVVQEGAVHVSDLATRFGVDVSTIRRDLQALEKQERLQRVHGGALPVKKATSEHAGGSAVTQDVRIGRTVARMVGDGETIFLGPGRLPLEVARCLREPLQITIITNGLDVAHWIAANTTHTL
ncbi:MAG: DeoR/GlpR family DNA-binding transcription regulator, partial [Anaerolineae bacterium]